MAAVRPESADALLGYLDAVSTRLLGRLGRFDVLRGRFEGLTHFALRGGSFGVTLGAAASGNTFVFRLFFEVIVLVGHIPPIL